MRGQDTGVSPVPPDVLTTRVAEDLVSIVDFVGRLVTAVHGGSVHYLRDKAGQLAGAAQRLESRLAGRGGSLDPRLAQLVAEHGRHYLAGRALFPAAPSGSSVMQDDLGEILRALSLGDHARACSPHEVVQREVLPAIRVLRGAAGRASAGAS